MNTNLRLSMMTGLSTKKRISIGLILCVLEAGFFLGCSRKPGENGKIHQQTSPASKVVPSRAFADVWNNTFTFDSLKGRKKVAFVFNARCPHCLKQAVVVSAMLSDFKARNVEFVGISLNSPANTVRFIQQHFLCCTILLTSKIRAINDFGIRKIPAILLIDESNRIIEINEGEISQSELVTKIREFTAPRN